MKVLAVCLMAAALVGMVASTPLEKIEGETLLNVVEGEEAISSMDLEVLKEGPGVVLNVVEGEEAISSPRPRPTPPPHSEEAISSMDIEVLKEGPGVEGNCKFAGIVADSGICRATCNKYGYHYMAYCSNHKCWCARHGGRCPC